MKKLFIAFFVMTALAACTDSISTENYSGQTESLSPTSLFSDFSIILSKALSSEPSLRNYIRDEALKQFDKDYDVFYPWVKEQVIDESGRTFREILVLYDIDNKLPLIEERLPLLNIMVPDWSWLDAFSIHDWESEDSDISVGYLSEDYGVYVYQHGEYEGLISPGNIPAFPVVIIKNNERMKLTSPATKGVDAQYDFIDPEFDGRNVVETKASTTKYDREIATEPCNNFVLASELDPRVIGAYNEFRNNDYAAHRDYIYYGMTNEITAGKRNAHIYEYIAKFSLATLDSQFITESEDFVNLPSEYIRYVSITDDVLMNKFIYDGNLELYFNIYMSPKDGVTTEISKYKSVKFTDVFQLSKVHVEYRNKTLFRDPKWVFTVDKGCFIPKWCEANIQLPLWDINMHSTTLKISVVEYDDSVVDEFTKSVKITRTNNFTADVSSEIKGEIGNASATGAIKLSYGVTNEKETIETITVKRTTGSDELGDVELNYTAPIISSAGTYNGKSGYYVNLVGVGNYVTMMILPRYI
ncbi:MAG: hypothetical protein K2O58_06640 [Bacteroidales bacterium]|nr:hypothetical protein [Bacteroidales bacterium]